ncbi:alpha-amylase 4N-like [Anopheles cruzii]|uniref:alpha-amylase 4N-like n=1 Tax=Anopheles cruzii TaxID=68878 RepID=UPI0022EC3375|nr:alpha-amylase 4N-like [Anopheles cruzii]
MFNAVISDALQLGPFTLPSLGNAGAFGFANGLLNASVDPLSRRASFGVQAPQASPSLTNPFAALADRFRNSASNLLQGLTPGSDAFGTGEAGPVLSAAPALPAIPQLAFLSPIPLLQQLERLGAVNGSLSALDGGSQLTPVANLQNTANSLRKLASSGYSRLTNLVPGMHSGIEQFAQTIQTVASPQLWRNLSSNRAERLSQGLNTLASGLADVLVNLPNITDVPAAANSSDRKNPHFYPGHNVIVHLFEWKFEDIALECETVLGPAGFGGVQVSPVSEAIRAPNRPWWERYQPISYEIRSRSGDERQFAEMVHRCQRAQVRIYVDIIANHMAANGTSVPFYGTGGSPSDPSRRLYPGVPFNRTHFHPDCLIASYQNASEVRNCQLGGLPDLNQTEPYVQQQFADLMNRLIDLGVAGFRMDASKHMWPGDLASIYQKLKPLNIMFDYPPFATPFIYQEVFDLGGESVTAAQYTDLGTVTEFKYSLYVGSIFHSALPASNLQALAAANATKFGLLASESALVFVDNHSNQRSHGVASELILTHKDLPQYVQAVAFTLANDYGTVRLMSSYAFEANDQGPPADALEQILPPGFAENGSCLNGWVCEHRWPVFRRLVAHRNFVLPAGLTDIQATNETFAFCRGNIGFAVFNAGTVTRDLVVRTCLPAGEYCDLITGEKQDTHCTGTRVLVNQDTTVSLTLPAGSSLVLDLRNRVL